MAKVLFGMAAGAALVVDPMSCLVAMVYSLILIGACAAGYFLAHLSDTEEA